MDTLINLIIQVVAGAIGGNAVGAGVKDVNLGTLGNTIAGAIGGGVRRTDCAGIDPSTRTSRRGSGYSVRFYRPSGWWQNHRRDFDRHRRHRKEQDGARLIDLPFVDSLIQSLAAAMQSMETKALAVFS